MQDSYKIAIKHITVLFITLIIFFYGTILSAVEINVKFDKIPNDKGLSQNSIVCIMQDNEGYMWFGTTDGVNKYNGYSFQVFGNGLFIRSLYQDKTGKIWIGTDASGLYVLDKSTGDMLNYKHDPEDEKSISSNNIRSVIEDSKGNLWLGTYGGGLNKFNIENETFVSYEHTKAENSLSNNNIRAMVKDENENIWIATMGGGLNKFSIENGTFTHYRESDGVSGINDDRIITISKGNNDILWVGTYSEGLLGFNTKTEKVVQNFKNDAENNNTISSNLIQSILEDSENVVWVGTYGQGLNKIDIKTGKVNRFKSNIADPYSIPDDTILSLYEDNAGLMWAGTNWEGICTFEKQERFSHIKHNPNNENSLASDPVWSVTEDKNGMIWIANSDGTINKYNREKEQITRYKYKADPEKEYVDIIDIRKIFICNENRIWVGTYNNGLYSFNSDTETFTHHPYINENGEYIKLDIRDIYKDSNNNLWLGTFGNGLCRYGSADNTFECFIYNENDIHSISNNNVRSIYEDENGYLWIGTYGGGLNRFDLVEKEFQRYSDNKQSEHPHSDKISCVNGTYGSNILWLGTYGSGLALFDKRDGSFSYYSIEDGLPSSVVYSVMRDSDKNLWLSHNKGITKINMYSGSFTNFDLSDGLQSMEFNSGAYHKGSDGTMYMGGVNGLNIFKPENISKNNYNPPLVLTSFRIFDEEVPHKRYKNGSIHLGWTENFFSFEFASLDYKNPDKNLYRYKLEGFSDKWIHLGNKHYASYTNLNKGQYTLQIQGTNSDGKWSNNILNIDISIEAKPWETPLAYAIYSLVGLLLISGAGYFIKVRFDKKKNELAREKVITEKLRHLDKLKDDFLANTSHELRTPITGIIGIAESLLDGASGELSDEMRLNLFMIATSGKRLNTLVNDILDYSKMKEDEIHLQQKGLDLRSTVNVVLTITKPLIKDKNLTLINDIPDDIAVYADENRLQQIFLNLVGNAVKFTRKGTIVVSAEKISKDFIEISVSDTGIGIEPSQIKNIFKSFEQIDSSISKEQGGTGLGLPITKKLVELHGGEIRVESNINKGSTFYFTLPVSTAGVTEQYINTKTISYIPKRIDENIINKTPIINEDSKDNINILAVDDEVVNLKVISNFLSIQNYNISTATNGEDALKLIEESETIPDLVILDIMMPKMSGYDVCKYLRERYNPTELPIILLTAKNRASDVVTGFNLGANDYLQKPFDKVELIARINFHIELSKTAKELRKLNRELETLVYKRTEELEQANEELEQTNEELENSNIELEHSNSELIHTNNRLENTLRKLKDTQEILITQEKMASLGSFMAGIAHELKNPLNFINNFSVITYRLVKNVIKQFNTYKNISESNSENFYKTKDTLSRIKKLTEKIVNHGDRANKVLQSMLSHFYRSEKEIELFDINSLVKEYSNIACHGYRTKYPAFLINIEYELDENIEPVMIMPLEMGRAIQNAVNNSCDAIKYKQESDKVFTPQIKIKTTDKDDTIEINIEDNGKGIPKAILKKVFEPFYTTKPPRTGTGLGLSYIYDTVVNKHSGEIKIESDEGEYTNLRIILPKRSDREL